MQKGYVKICIGLHYVTMCHEVFEIYNCQVARSKLSTCAYMGTMYALECMCVRLNNTFELAYMHAIAYGPYNYLLDVYIFFGASRPYIFILANKLLAPPDIQDFQHHLNWRDLCNHWLSGTEHWSRPYSD